jgi:hypothetical protein
MCRQGHRQVKRDAAAPRDAAGMAVFQQMSQFIAVKAGLHATGRQGVMSCILMRHALGTDPLQERINKVSALAHRVKSKLENLDKSNDAAKKVGLQARSAGTA